MTHTVSCCAAIGVGIDTARYGHHVTFLRDDRQPAAKSLMISESRTGYDELHSALCQLHERNPLAHFHVRIDAAGQYAVNMERFLRELPFPMTISTGEPGRNKSYREAHFPKRKSDATDSHANARYAVVEQPWATPDTPPEFQQLREVVTRLESQVRHRNRLTNQLHNLLSRVFPELALVAPDLAARSVLRLLQKYPTPQKIAAAQLSSLTAIPYLKEEKAKAIQTAARHSVGSMQGDIAGELVRQRVQEIQQCRMQEKQLEQLMTKALDAITSFGHVHLQSIPGIGKTTAAVLVAKIVSIDRFATPTKMVSYFGIFPEESSSGVDKAGRPLPVGKVQMSKKGNDLVRHYLWHAARTGVLCNPALRSLYARQRAKGKRGDVALGHCMRKLLHLVFAIWKSGKPFDFGRYSVEKQQSATGRTEASPPDGQRSP
jgi:transposase